MTIARERPQPAKADPANNSISPESEERLHLGHLIECARTIAELQAATQALQAWAARYPEQANRLESVFEQLYLREESAREALAEAAAMGLCEEQIVQRDHAAALRRHVRAEDPREVFEPALRAARQALLEWQARYPQDPQSKCLLEQLAIEEEVAECYRHV